MGKNINENLKALHTIAYALGDLKERTVFVGGAIVGLYINDPAAEDLRPTKDVDIFLEITTSIELEQLRQKLTSNGFVQSADENNICRFLFEYIKVDVMSTMEIGWASANPWFYPGLFDLEERDVNGIKIRILSLAYFLASKFNAFHGRGKNSPRTSHDFEDIVYILDHQPDLVIKIKSAPHDVKKYLLSEFSHIIHEELYQEAVSGNLSYGVEEKRYQLIMDKLNAIVSER